ncbi:efflux RND transporter periplasmic adaptor subunit [Sphingobacterium psychroaquaticum]|uniref:RND family efflux transporter, MFP subunit n=1 Tax=Sphingobacterium psychroaquaticum TaxID=561061 RepID=A0A1X7JNX9_9SPHI|nr:efflux RND transporter periplasmic adaptor subunit [Sphingobacterium psychroaquaticum]QBQ40888.1 efflux RND transporter periplasmic adaptor subunit [Sphingobacterium psychroaquaticum]SMG29617.1 RND family efflux transporter, MFP subunit [Sphingobacterium psychroaquaticum]
MKRIIITVVIIAAAFAGIMFLLNKNKAKNEEETAVVAIQNAAVAVRAEVVDLKEVNAEYITNGVFAPKQEVKLSAEASGKVIRVLVSEGSYVKAGQTLAVINGDKQTVDVSNAQAVYNNAKAEVARFESAFATGGVTKQQLDQVKLQLENARNNLKSSQIKASDVNVTASFSGVVNKRNIEPGSYVSPGNELFEIVNVSTLKLKISVDEKNISQVKLGQSIKVQSPVLPEKTFTGKVSFIAPKADASLNFPVELEIQNNASNDLRAGMYGTAYFGADQRVNLLVIPRNAFVGSVSSNQVFAIEGGKAVLKEVVSGRSFGDYIEIVSGLEQGTQVITSGQINLLNGTPVEIIK